jgi:hypothetical protein
MGANAQTAVPAFVAGEILTAVEMTQVNTGIPVFADTTARDAAFGGSGEKVLAEGQFAYIEATKTTQYYNGSAWVVANGALVRVGGGTLSGSSTAFTNIFSSTYDAYKIVFSNISFSTTAYATMILGAATTNYVNFQPGANISGTYTNYFGAYGTASWGIAYTNITNTGFAVEVVNPNLPTITTISGGLFYNSSVSNGATMHGLLNNSTQYTGFTIGTSSGNITGTVNVYGYTLS